MTDPSYAELQAEVSNLDVAFESMSRARWTAERERDNAKGYAAEMDAAYTQWRERALKAEKALQSVRDVFPRVVCPRCSAFEFEVEEANRIIDAALKADD